MVSASWTVAGRESVLGVLARWLRIRGRQVRAFLAVALRFVLVAGGLGAITAGAWTASPVAGWVTLGVSLLVLEWAVKRR